MNKGFSVNRQAAQAITVMLNGFPQSAAADKQALLLTFGRALSGVSDQAIIDAAQRYVSGLVPGQSATFAPAVAEFSQEARRLDEEQRDRLSRPRRNLFIYRKPNAPLLERNITKEYAFRLIDQGVHPRGSIWCPGPLDNRPDIGDLFAPDPKWKPARSIDWKSDTQPYQPDDSAARIRMGFKMAVLSAGLALGKVDDVAQANKEGLDSLMALAQRWGVTIPESLWAQRAA